MIILLQQFHFLHKIYFNELPFEHVVLSDNRKFITLVGIQLEFSD